MRAVAAVSIATAAAALAACGAGIDAGEWRPAWADDCPVWSPDSSRLAFSRHALYGEGPDTGLYLYERRTQTLRRLLRQEVEALAWSEDGSKLLVAKPASGDGRFPKLFLFDPGTGSQRLLIDLAQTRIAHPPDSFERVVASPSFSRLVVQRAFRGTSSGDSWIVETEHGRVRVLTRTPGVHVRWSPDGLWLAYSDLDHVFLVRADGRVRRRVGAFEAGVAGVSTPLFSPDSRQVAYVDSLRGKVFVVDVGTGAGRQLEDTVAPEGELVAWSSDGSRLLLSGSGLVIIDSSGHTRHRLPDWGGAWSGTGENCPSFSPDGRAIAFLRTWPAGFGGSQGAVYVAPADLGTAHSVDDHNATE